MAKPTVVPLWDTNDTATVVTTSGHITDGFVVNEVPTAQEFNYWMRWVGQWDNWLNGLWDGVGNLTLDNDASVKVTGTGTYKHGTVTLMVNPQTGSPESSATTYALMNGGVSGNSGPLFWRVPINLPVGKRITAILSRVKDSASGPTRVRASFLRSADGVNESIVATATTVGTAGTAQDCNLFFFETVAFGKAYELQFDVPSGSGVTQVYQIAVQYDQL